MKNSIPPLTESRPLPAAGWIAWRDGAQALARRPAIAPQKEKTADASAR